MNNTKKILAFGAHPDDIEFGCGGLLIKEINRGARVKLVICSFGEAGTNGTKEERKEEAENAAKFVGAEIEFIDLGGDSHMEYNPKTSMKIAEMIRSFKPNIVLTTSLSENQHPDHIVVAESVRAACRLARYGGIEELKHQDSHVIDNLYYYPSNPGLYKNPDIIVDVSLEFPKWVEAMSFHKSQMKTKNYINMVESRAKFLGTSAGVEYAVALWVNDPVFLDSIFDAGSSRKY
jgi:bacillithiol biosynthesis deacetylase BshB1